jgi:GMP synthase (glutamine-hydrolysing)
VGGAGRCGYDPIKYSYITWNDEMSVMIIKHVEIEGPGLIGDCLKEEKIPYQILNLESGVHLPKPDDYAGIVILGGLMNVYEEDRYPFLREEDLFIKEAIQRGKAVLGFCLGAQLVAKALGAKVTKALVKEIGWFDVSLTGAGLHDPLFSRLPETFSVFQWHEDTFNIPSAGKLIATSNPIAHQAFRYGENAYGLQFHLEVTEEMIREWMKTYEDKFNGFQTPLVPKLKILSETERKIGAYKKRGIKFFKNVFRQTLNH